MLWKGLLVWSGKWNENENDNEHENERQLGEKSLSARRGVAAIHTGRANPYWFTAWDSGSCGKLGHWWGDLKHEDYKSIVHSWESRTKRFSHRSAHSLIEPGDWTQSREGFHAPKLTEALLCSCICIRHDYEPRKKQLLAKLRWTWNSELGAFFLKRKKKVGSDSSRKKMNK